MKVDVVMELGRTLVPHTFAETTDPFVASERLRRWANSAVAAPSALLELVRDGLQQPAKTTQLLWTARWAQCGHPQVTLGHRLAAALMATHADAELTSQLQPRWPAFLIVMPSGLLSVPSTPRPWTVDYLTVLHTDAFVDVVARGRDTDWMLGMHYRDFATGLRALDDASDAWEWEETEPNELHRRVLQLLWRLVIAVEMEAAGLQYVSIRNADARARRTSGARKIRPVTYALMREVSVDCREAIGAYVAGRVPASPTVRTLVSGHWKRQAYGVELSLRRWIHVEPYWRGADANPDRAD